MKKSQQTCFFPYDLDTPSRSLPDGRAQLIRGSEGLEDPVALGPPLPGEGAGESFGKGGRRSGPGWGALPATPGAPRALPESPVLV